MIIKSSDLMYIFDFDGTIINSIGRLGYIESANHILSSRLLINPQKYDIRWTILTSWPKISMLLINFVCRKHNLYPSQLITSPYWIKNPSSFNSNQYKLNILTSILEGSYSVKYTNRKVQKIIFISNDIICSKYINTNRTVNNLIAMSASDFYLGTFNSVIS